jgi:ABC-type transport system substrate-binding protein
MSIRNYVRSFVLLPAFGVMAVTAALAADPEPQYGGELIYVMDGEHYSLFPGRQNGSSAQDAWLYALENLVEINEKNEIIPWLAKSWTISDDKKTVSFQIQDGVKFHDGTPFNAEAVKFVFDEAMSKVFGYAKMLEGLDKVVAEGEHKVTFHFEEPFAAFLPNLAYRSMVIFSPTAYKKNGEEWMATNMVGTGPFIQKELVKGSHLIFAKNPDYWQKGKPYLDSVRINIVPDMAIRAAMLEKGEADRTISINDFDIPRLEADPDIRVRVVPSTRQFYVVLNHHVYPLGDPKVRKAFNYAIDKEGIVRSVFAGKGAVLSKAPVISESVVAFTDMREPGQKTIFPYDPERAKQLLKNAGYEDRDGDGVVENPKGKKLTLKLWTRKGKTKGDFQIAQLLQTFLKDVGVEVKLQVWENAAFGAAVKLGPVEAQYDMALLSWGIPTADPDEPMMLMMYTKAWKPVGANRSFYSSEEVDRLTVLAHHETDAVKRKEYVRLWMAELLRDAPVIFLPTLAFNLGSRTYLHGDRILGVDQYPARFSWIDKEEMKRQGVSR